MWGVCVGSLRTASVAGLLFRHSLSLQESDLRPEQIGTRFDEVEFISGTLLELCFGDQDCALKELTVLLQEFNSLFSRTGHFD